LVTASLVRELRFAPLDRDAPCSAERDGRGGWSLAIQLRLRNAAWAAAKRATGRRCGEHDT
jgi:hypothetical protein